MFVCVGLPIPIPIPIPIPNSRHSPRGAHAQHHPDPGGGPRNGEPQQEHLTPLTFCACVFLKPLLFADNPNLRVVMAGTAYKYNQEELRLEADKQVKTTNLHFAN
jgi:hypothetical protein